MQREVALVYSSNARPAGANGVRPGHYAPGEAEGARALPGVTEFVEQVPASDATAFCSATTRAGTSCKARPVGGSDICIGHTRQSAAT